MGIEDMNEPGPRPSRAAERMRVHRTQTAGTALIELRETEVDVL
jgi:hypothetical protein